MSNCPIPNCHEVNNLSEVDRLTEKSFESHTYANLLDNDTQSQLREREYAILMSFRADTMYKHLLDYHETDLRDQLDDQAQHRRESSA